MKRTKIFAYFLVALLLLLFPAAALAVPSLGVAPAASNPGVYYGTTENGSDPVAGIEWLEAYQQYFVSGAVAVPAGWNDGFSMPSSGQDLTVWWGYNQGFPEANSPTSWDVWLLTNSSSGDGFSFGGMDFVPVYSNTQIDGYQTDFASPGAFLPAMHVYYGLNLGSILSPAPPNMWTPAPAPPFNGEFYFNTAQIQYSGFNYVDGDPDTRDDWLFAVTGFDVIQLTDFGFFEFNQYLPNPTAIFSPKTTSSGYGNPVPEPATMLLLGSGLIGLAGIRRRFRKSQ